jgi:hypothetical protein
MLRNARSQNRALELPAIMQAGIAQHGARFNEIRARGFEVENELDRDNGAIRSRYVLKFDPEMEARYGCVLEETGRPGKASSGRT